MNERIKQLAERQTGAILMDLVMPDAGMPERIKWNIGCTAKHLEKFAELIVQECVKFCEHESNDDEHDEYDMGMWVKAESIKAAIMKEFGIKE